MASRSYDDDSLRCAVAGSRSWRGVLRELGLSATSASAIRSVRSRAVVLGLPTEHFTGQRRWTEDQLADAVAGSRSWIDVAEALGLSGGSSPTTIKGHARRLGLETAHLGATHGPVSASWSGRRPVLDSRCLPRAGSLIAASYFVLSGFDVSWPLEPCRYDLLADRAHEVLRVQVKTTRNRPSTSYVADLSSSRGARHTYDPDDIDCFFIVDGMLQCYLIPVDAVGGRHAVSLDAYPEYKLPAMQLAEARIR